MRLTPELKFAIKEYFNPIYRHAEGEWKGFWLPGFKEQKIRNIDSVCAAEGYGLMIVPGVIYITTNKGTFEFEKKNWWMGRRLPSKR